MANTPFVLLACSLFAAACAGDAAWQVVGESNLTPAQRVQQQRANEARDALASTLLGELTAALGAGGAPAAIAVCQQRAPAIAAEVATQRGVRIGRTSRRLRNPDNQAPAWASTHVAGDGGEPAWFQGPARQLGALLPIRLLPQCVQCHGAPEQLAAEVKTALGARYPHDQAVGFAAGDLRGWFWVEVPATN